MSDETTKSTNGPSRLFICLLVAIFAVAGLVIFLIAPWPDEHVPEPFVDHAATTQEPSPESHPSGSYDASSQTPEEPPSIDILGGNWRSIERELQSSPEEPQPSPEEREKILEEFKVE